MRLIVLISLAVALQWGCATGGLGAGKSGPASASDAPLSERGEATYHLMLGELALARELPAEAALEFCLAAEAGEDPELARRATELALAAEDADLAGRAAARWHALAPEDSEAAGHHLVQLLQAGKSRQAVKVLRRLKDLLAAEDPLRPEMRLVPVLLQVDDRVAALEALEKVLGRKPEQAGALVALSSLALVADRAEQAQAWARAAVAADPEWPGAALQLARVLIAADRAYEGLAQARPRVVPGGGLAERLEYASLLIMAGRPAEAALLLEQALLERPGLPVALRMLGLVEYQAGHLDYARRAFLRLAVVEAHADEAAYYLGLIALDQGDFRTAGGWFRQVGEGDYFIAAQIGIRDAHVTAGEEQAAMETLDALASDHPDYLGLARTAQAELQMELGNHARAVALYREAVAADPAEVQFRYGLALALERGGQLDEALQMLEAILEEHPGDATALNALGYTLVDNERELNRGMRYIEQAYALDPDNPAVIDSMGWARYRQGDLAGALGYLQQAYRLMPDPEVAAHLGEVQWVAGEPEAAIDTWTRALDENPGNRLLLDVMERFGQ